MASALYLVALLPLLLPMVVPFWALTSKQTRQRMVRAHLP